MFKRLTTVMLIGLAIFIWGCPKDEDDRPPDQPPIPTMDVSGTVRLPEGSTLPDDSLEVVSFAGGTAVNGTGGFTVQVVSTDGLQLLFFQQERTNQPVMIGIYDPAADSVRADAASTALALTFFNFNLMEAPADKKQEYAAAVQQNPQFPQLVNLLTQAYLTDAASALDFDTHLDIYQMAVLIMKSTMESMGSINEGPSLDDWFDPPRIEDAPGQDIVFKSPRFVYYGAGIYPSGQTQGPVITVNCKAHILEFQIGWPPVIVAPDEETPYNLRDGSYRIHLNCRWDFAKILEFDADPAGRATLFNTGKFIVSVVNMAVGGLPVPNFITLPRHFTIRGDRALQLTIDLARGENTDFVIHFCGLLADNIDNLALWYWEDAVNDARRHFVGNLAGFLTNAAVAIKLLGIANSFAPFVVDIFGAPPEVTYYVTLQGGQIVSGTQNLPPEPHFTVDPPAGIIGTVFTFDASTTTDDQDPLSALQFRWDFNGDGQWDTPWQSLPTATHSYSESEAYAALLQVKDSGQLTSTGSVTVNVGGGSGTATHVKLFRDDLPWSSNAQTTMLENLGFTEGQGPQTYEIIPSAQMATLPLIPGEDLVFISNDQGQTFYNAYAANQMRFTNFVYMGGSLFWEACDQGWAYGSIEQAGIILPGNVSMELDIDWNNYVQNPNLPLVQGLPYQMDHNYASHESFFNLPNGATVYCVNEEGEPTLMEYSIGGGWVLMTGQPLEHQYDRIWGNPDMEQLLPRIVAYFCGQPFQSRLVPEGLPPSQISSYSPQVSRNGGGSK